MKGVRTYAEEAKYVFCTGCQEHNPRCNSCEEYFVDGEDIICYDVKHRHPECDFREDNE